MSLLKRLRKRVAWESDVPRCQTCRHFRERGYRLVNSLPKIVRAHCVLHTFETRPCAVCDCWATKFGETLEGGIAQAQTVEGAPPGETDGL